MISKGLPGVTYAFLLDAFVACLYHFVGRCGMGYVHLSYEQGGREYPGALHPKGVKYTSPG